MASHSEKSGCFYRRTQAGEFNLVPPSQNTRRALRTKHIETGYLRFRDMGGKLRLWFAILGVLEKQRRGHLAFGNWRWSSWPMECIDYYFDTTWLKLHDGPFVSDGDLLARFLGANRTRSIDSESNDHKRGGSMMWEWGFKCRARRDTRLAC